MTLRRVEAETGISNPYLSQLERGERRPGPRVLKRLASFYGVSAHDLLQRAGHLEDAGISAVDEASEVERAYQFVLSDQRFRMGTRPRGVITIEAKRFIVEMYERLTGKRLLE